MAKCWARDIDITGELRPQLIYRQIMWSNTGKLGMAEGGITGTCIIEEK